MTYSLRAPGFQPLDLKCDILVSLVFCVLEDIQSWNDAKHLLSNATWYRYNERAMAAAEKRAKESVDKKVAKGPGGISKARVQLWFEKFHWFITSAGALQVKLNSVDPQA